VLSIVFTVYIFDSSYSRLHVGTTDLRFLFDILKVFLNLIFTLMFCSW